MKTQLSVITTLVLIGLSHQSHAAVHEGIDNMLSEGKVSGLLRYRYENVDQDGVANKAHASTLLTRLNYTSGTLNAVKAVFEVDNVTSIGAENYNSTVNGVTGHPVVADPTGTEVNQAHLQFNRENVSFILGRQRINLDDQRFVGAVAWRQNEQTYDGYRAIYKAHEALRVDYSYIYNVNRIFGQKSAASDLHGKLHLGNISYQANPDTSITGFAYLFDFDTAPAISTQTFGIRFSGKLFDEVAYTLSYANQQEYADNPNDFSADYLLAQVQGKLSHLGWTIGYESLGSDNGVGFSTPLATAHKFQGFADKFLGTPPNGVADWYFGLNGALSGVKLAVTYHQFDSVKNDIDYGSEIDFTATYKVSDRCNLLLKYAMYDADEVATDTDKLWLMLSHKF
ncbi:alginate export family protein [Pseudoalteromonas sp. T1lg23B]|uniref:alginate export family protein n=1 Tax=Pseudoalteromonas sp. T1lg23B TaxID=2077097 RepID=UPI000CF73247|nr:alginate export family protein [Pseudoalteromonas sp. T1lg23B]